MREAWGAVTVIVGGLFTAVSFVVINQQQVFDFIGRLREIYQDVEQEMPANINAPPSPSKQAISPSSQSAAPAPASPTRVDAPMEHLPRGRWAMIAQHDIPIGGKAYILSDATLELKNLLDFPSAPTAKVTIITNIQQNRPGGATIYDELDAALSFGPGHRIKDLNGSEYIVRLDGASPNGIFISVLQIY